MKSETKIHSTSSVQACQNCKQKFTIEPEDFEFYTKIKVPPPTWCPECQLQRRLSFRNERALYKRKESLTGKDIISIFSEDKPVTVYDAKTWWSDQWDPLEYGRDYDFSKPFFEQYKELLHKFPYPSLLNWNAVNSDYCNMTTDNKNCYLVFGGDFNEDCRYSTFNFHSKDSQDLYWVDKVELSYECIDSENCYKVMFSQYARDCSDSSFLINCVGCQNCFGCVNLRNKSYCIFNKQYSKEEYQNRMKEIDLYLYSSLQNIKGEFEGFRLTQPHKYSEIVKSVNSKGNNIHNAKNCKMCFDVYDDVEDCRNIWIAGWRLRDALNCNHLGHNSELVYDSFAVFSGSQRIAFSHIVASSQNIQYSYNVSGSSNLFGCVGIRQKQYCILNKQYTKEEYEKLVPKIVQHMNEMPYKDRNGRIYTYGEFFPPELSPFAYNETVAQERIPLSKKSAEEAGYRWKELEEKNYQPDINAEDLPDAIKDVMEDILEKTIACSHGGSCDENCSLAFKIIPQELEFYKKMNLPLPRLCPNCRHYQRLKQRNPLKLWHRACQCSGQKSSNGVYSNTANHSHGSKPCPNEFETSYAPERPEIVYCEACYQAEVV